jgi:hypothetical protein
MNEATDQSEAPRLESADASVNGKQPVQEGRMTDAAVPAANHDREFDQSRLRLRVARTQILSDVACHGVFDCCRGELCSSAPRSVKVGGLTRIRLDG